jgi:hypothetical protein
MSLTIVKGFSRHSNKPNYLMVVKTFCGYRPSTKEDNQKEVHVNNTRQQLGGSKEIFQKETMRKTNMDTH